MENLADRSGDIRKDRFQNSAIPLIYSAFQELTGTSQSQNNKSAELEQQNENISKQLKELKIAIEEIKKERGNLKSENRRLTQELAEKSRQNDQAQRNIC